MNKYLKVISIAIVVILVAYLINFIVGYYDKEEPKTCEFFCIFCKGENCSKMEVRRIIIPNITNEDYDYYIKSGCITTLECTIYFENITEVF